jgi:hypothetical protein
MKALSQLAFVSMLFISCEPQKNLYSWGNYSNASYSYLKNSDEKSTQELIEIYKKLIDKQTGTRMVPPPGICADYGFLLLQQGKTDEGKALLEREVELYPESAIYIERVLKLMEQ